MGNGGSRKALRDLRPGDKFHPCRKGGGEGGEKAAVGRGEDEQVLAGGLQQVWILWRRGDEGGEGV